MVAGHLQEKQAKIRADAHNEEVRRQKQLTGKKKTYDMSL